MRCQDSYYLTTPAEPVTRSAMKSADFIWDEAKLSRFIANPDEIVPGNNMKPYGGLASASDRDKVISFLQSIATE
jgi:cytochrome c